MDPRTVAPEHAERPQTCKAVSTTRSLPASVDRAVPAIAAYRDGGCIPHELSRDVLVEMMAFLAGKPLEGVMVPMFLEDMQFDGADSGAISWGDDVSDEAKAASPVVVIGCGLSGILAGIRLSQARLPFVIVEKDEGPGGTWWENQYPGARVDVGSHHYCYAFEPSHHWTEYFCQQPELRDYFVSVLDKYELPFALSLQHGGYVPDVGRADEPLACRHSEPGRNHGGPRGSVRHQRGRFAEHPQASGHPRHGLVRRASVPLGALAGRARRDGQAVRARRRRRLRVPDRADHRGPGRAAHDLPTDDPVDAAESAVSREGAPR